MHEEPGIPGIASGVFHGTCHSVSGCDAVNTCLLLPLVPLNISDTRFSVMLLTFVYPPSLVCDAENIFNEYTAAGNRIGEDEPGDRSKGEIVADITTTFTILLAIFFPSCTGACSQHVIHVSTCTCTCTRTCTVHVSSANV